MSFGSGTTSCCAGRFPTLPPLVTAFWSDSDPSEGGAIYHRVLNSTDSELAVLRDSLIGQASLQFEPTSGAVITYDQVAEFSGSSDVVCAMYSVFLHALILHFLQNNTFQVILLTDGSTSYSVFLYNSIAFGDGDTIIGFNDGTRFYTLAGGEGVSALSDVTGLPFSSNVGIDGVYIFRTDSSE